MVNNTMKIESPLENGIHLRKWNFTESSFFTNKTGKFTIVSSKNTISDNK